MMKRLETETPTNNPTKPKTRPVMMIEATEADVWIYYRHAIKDAKHVLKQLNKSGKRYCFGGIVNAHGGCTRTRGSATVNMFRHVFFDAIPYDSTGKLDLANIKVYGAELMGLGTKLVVNTVDVYPSTHLPDEEYPGSFVCAIGYPYGPGMECRI